MTKRRKFLKDAALLSGASFLPINISYNNKINYQKVYKKLLLRKRLMKANTNILMTKRLLKHMQKNMVVKLGVLVEIHSLTILEVKFW